MNFSRESSPHRLGEVKARPRKAEVSRGTHEAGFGSTRPFLDFDFDVVTDDTDVVAGNPNRCRRAHDLTGSDIED